MKHVFKLTNAIVKGRTVGISDYSYVVIAQIILISQHKWKILVVWGTCLLLGNSQGNVVLSLYDKTNILEYTYSNFYN